jgi:hypothetical protein
VAREDQSRRRVCLTGIFCSFAVVLRTGSRIAVKRPEGFFNAFGTFNKMGSTVFTGNLKTSAADFVAMAPRGLV